MAEQERRLLPASHADTGGPRDTALRALRPVREELAERPGLRFRHANAARGSCGLAGAAHKNAARTVRREAAALQQWRAAFRNGPASVGAPSAPHAQIGCFRFAPRVTVMLRMRRRIAAAKNRGCLKI